MISYGSNVCRGRYCIKMYSIIYFSKTRSFQLSHKYQHALEMLIKECNIFMFNFCSIFSSVHVFNNLVHERTLLMLHIVYCNFDLA